MMNVHVSKHRDRWLTVLSSPFPTLGYSVVVLSCVEYVFRVDLR